MIFFYELIYPLLLLFIYIVFFSYNDHLIGVEGWR